MVSKDFVIKAGHYQLENLVAIVDYNRLQIDGRVREVMNIDPIEDKYRSFGWDVLRINGHDMDQVVQALQQGKERAGTGKPLAIIAETIKGKGISFCEDVAGWHSKIRVTQADTRNLTKRLKET